MSVRYYDRAITEKISNWVIDKNMKVLSPENTERLFSNRLDSQKDKPIKLPLIAISRDSSIGINVSKKQAKTYDGAHVLNSDGHSMTLNVIPITLNYSIDIYTKYFAEADEYARSFVFNLINYPDVTITVPYNNVGIQHTSTIQLGSSVNESSSSPQRVVQGQFTRMTIKFTVDDAYYFSVPFMKNWNILDDGSVVVKEDE